jgi:hypothetical protein
MHMEHRACWVSRDRAAALKRTGGLGQTLLLDTFKGFILVEPSGSELADGAVLSSEEADYELQPIWFTGPKAKLREARRRLGLEQESGALTA